MNEEKYRQKLMELVGAWLCVDGTCKELVTLFHARALEIEDELVNEFMEKGKENGN